MHFNINVFPDIRADFRSNYDTCYGKVIMLSNLSVSDAGPIRRSAWYANGQNFANTFNAEFNILQPDYYQMKVEVEDQNGCIDTLTRTVPFFPLPKDELIAPQHASGCQPFRHQFEKLNNYLTDEYDIQWDFGDGHSGRGVSPVHVYEQYGDFDIGVNIINPFGCKIQESFQGVIHVDRSPLAGFAHSPENPSNFRKEIQIIDQSEFTSTWFYEFEGLRSFNIAEPNFTFPDTGVYKVTQIVTAENGCTDTLIKYIDVEPKYTFYLPNAFTPGIDGVNDTYRPAGIPFGLRDYRLLIFDRWGKRVFETTNIDEGWNGKDSEGRNMLPGAYAVKVSFKTPRGSAVTLSGTAVLVQ